MSLLLRNNVGGRLRGKRGELVRSRMWNTDALSILPLNPLESILTQEYVLWDSKDPRSKELENETRARQTPVEFTCPTKIRGE